MLNIVAGHPELVSGSHLQRDAETSSAWHWFKSPVARHQWSNFFYF